MSMTTIVHDTEPGVMPEKFRPFVRECVDRGEMWGGYRREFQEWTTATDGLTIEFIWHTHDGQSGTTETVCIADYKRDGKYI